MFSVLQGIMSTSTEIIARWEEENKSSCQDTKHKAEVLKKLLKQCGFSSKLSVKKARTVLASLNTHKVPFCSDQVDEMLKTRGEKISGPGRSSKQQRKMILLELLDPSLKNKLGTTVLKTGNYQWTDRFTDDILTAVVQYLTKWVNGPTELSFNYQYTKTAWLWKRRRQAGFEWVKSLPGRTYIKEVYKIYAAVFESVVTGIGRNTFGKALEKIYDLKHAKEKGHLRQLATTIMHPLYSSCQCTADNVFDRFSFIFNNLFKA